MPTKEEQQGLEFTAFDLTEQSAGAGDDVYRPVASVISLGSFEIDFEPDEETPAAPRRATDLPDSDSPSKSSATNETPLADEPGAPEVPEATDDILALHAPSAQSVVTPASVPEDMDDGWPEPVDQPTDQEATNDADDLLIGMEQDFSDLPPSGTDSARFAARPRHTHPVADEEPDTNDLPPPATTEDKPASAGPAFGGLLDNLSSFAAEGAPPLQPLFGPEGEDVLGSLFAEEEQRSSHSTRAEIEPEEEDFAAASGYDSVAEDNDDEELSADSDALPQARNLDDDFGGFLQEEEEERRQFSAVKRAPKPSSERVPLKLRGRLTGDPFPDRGNQRQAQPSEQEQADETPYRSAYEDDFNELVNDFAPTDLWGDGEDGSALPGGAAVHPLLPDDGTRPTRTAPDDGEVEALLTQAHELTYGQQPVRKRKKSAAAGGLDDVGDAADADALGGLGTLDAPTAAGLDGWGEVPPEDEDALDGMRLELNGMDDLDDAGHDAYEPFEDDAAPADGRQGLPPEGRAIIRRVERVLRRMPHFHELTDASRAWLSLLHSWGGEVKREGLTSGTRAWLGRLRSFTGLDTSLSPLHWRRTGFPDDLPQEDEDLTLGSGIPHLGDADGDDAGLLLGGDDGWGDSGAKSQTPPADDWGAPADPEAEAQPEADPNLPPEDILPEEDLSFSTADMLMQDSELGLSNLEDEFDLSVDGEAETPDDIPSAAAGPTSAMQALKKLGKKWSLLCYRSLDHYVGFQDNWWKLVDFLALIILTMAAAAFLSYWLYYAG